MIRIAHILLLVGLILLGLACEKRTNWSVSFDSKQKIPFGTYVLKKELKEIFKPAEIQQINQNTTLFFEENMRYKSNQNNYSSPLDSTLNQYRIQGTYLFLYHKNHHSNQTWAHLLDFVKEGNHAFISNQELNDSIASVLGLNLYKVKANSNPDSIYVQLSVVDSNKQYALKKATNTYYFNSNKNLTVLGHTIFNQKKYPNFVRIQLGKGFLYLHSQPFAFSNYHMLKEDHYQYVLDVFSYLPNHNTVFWDNHRIIPRKYIAKEENKHGGFFSALSFVRKNESLSYAFFLGLALVLLYLAFNYKRQQRVVPIYTAYENYSLQMVKSLALIYKKSNEYSSLIDYNIATFYADLNKEYNFTPKETQEESAQDLHQRTQVNLSFCNQILQNFASAKENPNLESFTQTNLIIQEFNQNARKQQSILQAKR